MKIKVSPIIVFCIFIFISCAGRQSGSMTFLLPDKTEEVEIVNQIPVENIIETKTGYGNHHLPDWFIAYANGGIAEVERMDVYEKSYCFIARNEGSNFEALNKWTENYSVNHDFTRMAALRIEKRLNSAATLYPDDEYGAFYEKLIKRAFGTTYREAQIADNYWIKKMGENNFLDTYEFFIFICMDRVRMREAINLMILETRSEVHPTREQISSINRLQYTFFEGF